MTTAVAHRGPDGDGFHHDAQRCTRATAAWRSSIAPAATSRWRTKTAVLDRLQRRDLQPSLAAPAARSEGPSVPDAVRHRSHPPRLRGVRPGVRRAARRDVRVRHLRRPPARAVRRARSAGQEAVLLHGARRRVPLRQRAAGAARSRRCGVARSICTALEGYLSLGYFIAPATIYRDVYKLLPGHWLRVANGRVEIAAVLGRHRVRHRRSAGRRAARRDRPDAAARPCTSGSRAKCRSARFSAAASTPVSSCPTWRRRWGSAGDRRRSASAKRRTTSSKPPRSRPRTSAAGTHAEVIEPRARRGDRPGHRASRRAAGRLVGDSDLVRLAGRPAARHRRAQRRRRRRELRRLRLPLRAARARGSARRWMPSALAPAAGWLGARWPRSPRLPKPLARRHAARESRPRSRGRVLPDLAFLKPADARRLMGLPAIRDPAASPVYAAVTEPYRRCPSTDAVQRARVCRPEGLPAERSAREGRPHEHGARPRGALPLLDRRVVELAFRIPASRKQSGRQGKALLRALARRRLPERAVAASEARVHGADRRLDRGSARFTVSR